MTKDSNSNFNEELSRFVQDNDIVDLSKLYAALKEQVQFDVLDLWEKADLAGSYWMLLLGNADLSTDRDLVNRFLRWKHLDVKDTARIVCIQAVENNHYRFVVRTYGVPETPTILFGLTPLLEERIVLTPQMLTQLNRNERCFANFLNRMHALAGDGYTISEIRATLRTKKFWNFLGIVYDEIKSIVSVEI